MPYLVYNYYFNDFLSRLPVYGDRCLDPYLQMMKEANITPIFSSSLLRPDDGKQEEYIPVLEIKPRFETR